jgi:hypothetical protein
MDWTRAASESTFVGDETEGANFGDKRLASRLAVIMSAAVNAPGDSFPTMAGGDAALEATYRFLNNARVTHEAVLAPHVRSTARRIRAAGRVVVAHDSTQLSFGPVPRRDLDLVGKGSTYGIDVHVSLAIAEANVPLGVLAATPFTRNFGDRRRPAGRNKDKASNIMHRWLKQVHVVRERIGDDADVVHVMDCEADDYATLSALVENGVRFVIRQKGDRRLDPRKPEKVRAVVAEVPVIARRDAAIAERRKATKRRHMSRAPVRTARTATLEVRAAKMTIARSVGAGTHGADSVALHLVEAVEPNPPPGQAPVEWWLWTTEPIETEQDVLAIIDAYRKRWTIEEYFKALKTGCHIEQRQLESRHALLNALALLAPVAWRLLLLRSLGRTVPQAPASTALTPLQLRALEGYRAKKNLAPLPNPPTIHDVMIAVAQLGGHITNNGSPGWIVLGRGLERLLDIELGLALALDALARAPEK